MEEVEFTHKELQDFARKLGALHPFLSDKERALLLAIFASSAEKVVVVVESEPRRGTFPSTDVGGTQAAEAGQEPSISELQQQLLNAYFPGGEESHGLSAKIAGTKPTKIAGTKPN